MKLSLRGEYAIRALIVLGLNYPGPVVRIQTISQRQNVPKRFLEQILNDLKTAGILESKCGMAGGCTLRLPPAQISLATIIRLVDGPLAPVSCRSENFYEKCTCPNEERCGIRSATKEVRDTIVKMLERITLANVCERVRHLNQDVVDPLDYVI